MRYFIISLSREIDLYVLSLSFSVGELKKYFL